MSGGGKSGGVPDAPERFDDILVRLRALVDRLEGGNLSLEDSLRSFEEGMDLCRRGAGILDEAEKRVEVLLAGPAGTREPRPWTRPNAMTSELTAWLGAERAEVDALFAQQLDAARTNGDPGRLVEAMGYSLLAPGKRLRPLLALAGAEAIVGPDGIDDSMRLGCASIELVHCYSLIHDDLPAMDDDDFRRGRPSNHKAFGEATAILAGDALLTLAFEWIAEAGQRTGRPGDFLRASLALARGAGMNGMVRGQARDLGEPPPTTIDALETLHDEKTAALFRAALEIGAAVAGANEVQRAALSQFGRRYGIAFQHADDLDDADHVAHAAAARERLNTLIGEAIAALAPLGARGQRLRSFAEALLATATATAVAIAKTAPPSGADRGRG